jgi:hypothetical protein
VFNLFNTTNLDLPDAFVGSPTFGQVLSAQAAAPDAAGDRGAVLSVSFQLPNSQVPGTLAKRLNWELDPVGSRES